MSRAHFKPYPTPGRAVAFNKMQGWYGTPPAAYQYKHSSAVEAIWCFMSEQEAARFQQQDRQLLWDYATMTFPLRLLQRMVTVRTDWSRK